MDANTQKYYPICIFCFHVKNGLVSNFLQFFFLGRFKEQRDMNANWQPVPEHKVPEPRPGTCTNDTKSLPDSNINFIRTHSLMDESVPPFFGAPVLIRTGLISRFTSIGNIALSVAQCGNFRIFLSLRFYVESFFENSKCLKMPFLAILEA